ncbi:MAG: hypothetical protein Q9217_002478 [Psora testacea]
MAVYEPHPLKRTVSAAQFESPAPKKLQRGQVLHHKAVWDAQPNWRRYASLQGEETADTLLRRSISLALEAVGFQAVEAGALESFHTDVKEYMAHFLADVRQSMLSCRRVQAIPQDFLQALRTHQLSLRCLLPHLDPPVSPSKSQFPLEIDPKERDDLEQCPSLGSLLKEASDIQAKSYVPKHFPDMPEKHTYQATPEYAAREQDPRRVRERATKEGRLAEEALRKLVTAGTSRPVEPLRPRDGKLSLRAKREQMWRDTMSATAQECQATSDDAMNVDKGKRREGEEAASKYTQGHLSLAVNAEKKYWRRLAR